MICLIDAVSRLPSKFERLLLMVFLRTSLLLDVNDRAETGNFERPVQEVCADAVHGRVDDLDAAPRVHGLVVDERAEVVVVLLGDGSCVHMTSAKCKFSPSLFQQFHATSQTK